MANKRCICETLGKRRERELNKQLGGIEKFHFEVDCPKHGFMPFGAHSEGARNFELKMQTIWRKRG